MDAELPADEASTPPGAEVGATATSGSPPELEESTGDELASTDGYAGTIDEEAVSPSVSAEPDPTTAAVPADSGIADAATEVPVDSAAVVNESGAAADAEPGTSSRSPGVVAAVASPDIAETALTAMHTVSASALPGPHPTPHSRMTSQKARLRS